MSRDYYIFKSGRIRREDNTIYFESDDGKRPIPIEDVESIYVFGELDFNTKLLNFISQHSVPVHIFNYYGFYSGTFYPREKLVSGFLLVKQVEHYTDSQKRLEIAKEIARATHHNILRNIRYYDNRGKEIEDIIGDIEEGKWEIESSNDIAQLMGAEGRIRDRYYRAFEKILGEEFKIEKRVKRPPNNMINCLISFGNSLMYTATLSEIYKTQLNPTVSYLHEPSERRFSLSLHIAEIFKPLVVDKIIFKLVNKNMVDEGDFDSDLNYCYLKESGRKKFIAEFDSKMETTVKHRRLKRNVSYKTLIRMECYKIAKHLMDMEKYEGLKAWW